jgi:hypothetical protein
MFWDKIASENFTWYQEWEKVLILPDGEDKK